MSQCFSYEKMSRDAKFVHFTVERKKKGRLNYMYVYVLHEGSMFPLLNHQRMPEANFKTHLSQANFQKGFNVHGM